MRIGDGLKIAALACMLVGAAPPGDGWSRTWATYHAELARQCPAKHLDLLAPADLRDALDTFKGSLSARARRRMDGAERRACASSVAGATCSNAGDVRVAQAHRLLPRLVASVCASFTGCAEQSDCTAAR